MLVPSVPAARVQRVVGQPSGPRPATKLAPRNQGYGSGASPLEDETARDVGTSTVQ